MFLDLCRDWCPRRIAETVQSAIGLNNAGSTRFAFAADRPKPVSLLPTPIHTSSDYIKDVRFGPIGAISRQEHAFVCG